MVPDIHQLCRRLLDIGKTTIQGWLKPSSRALVRGATADLARSKAELIAENAFLRQQLIILQRQRKRPKLTGFDRIKLLLLARVTPYWRQALLIVQPDTLLRWHRELYRIIWRRKSKPPSSGSRIPAETIALILQMSVENKTWGAERIRGELLKLGILVSKHTIQKYMGRYDTSGSSSQTWSTFLNNTRLTSGPVISPRSTTSSSAPSTSSSSLNWPAVASCILPSPLIPAMHGWPSSCGKLRPGARGLST